ncbi:MAG: hypothetical protein KDK54_21125 [Leptospiraceae bacterium]|nr:hypothetical protein [Leptospiraceae bacterium]
MSKNIYNTDLFLFIVGGILTFIFVLSLVLSPDTYFDVEILNSDGSFSYISSNGRELNEIAIDRGIDRSQVSHIGFPYVRVFFLLNGLFCIGLGFYYKNIENRIIGIWNILESSHEMKLEQLCSTLGLTRDFIIKNLKMINLKSQAQYIYDPHSDKIVNAKMMTDFSFSTKCSNCGFTLSETVPLNLSTPVSCPYCNTHISSKEFNELKSDYLKSNQTVITRSEGFNIYLFIFLVIVFWPLGVAYYFFATTKEVKETLETLNRENTKI